MPALRLEDFSEAADPVSVVLPPEEEREDELRQTAYEEGYSAGWEDATTACSDARAEREAEAARALQGLIQTREAAQLAVLLSLEPLLKQMVAILLPEMAQAALAPRVVQSVMALAEATVQGPMIVKAAPDVADPVERLLPLIARELNVRVETDAALPEGCIRISAGQRESQIDHSAALAAIARGVAEFFEIHAGEERDER